MIEVTAEDRVLEICIERPEAKNALTLAMYDAMSDALEQAEQSDDIRVVLFRGSHGVFTSGNDLQDFIEDPPLGEDSPVFRFLQKIVSFPKPVVAAVDGWAVGIGTTMLFHCDLVYASKRARFKMPFVDLALVPEAGSSLILPRMLGHQKAAELLFFSKKISAEEGEKLGFINEVVDADDLLELARKRAKKLAELAPNSLRLTKRLLMDAHHYRLEDAMSAEGALFKELLQSPEFSEAVSAFFEKRKPDFG
jgi:enoyl-CoA hydratase/carnithine racemase